MKNQKLYDLIIKSKKVLIISHISPDPDSISSGLLAYGFLKNNFNDKDIVFNVEDVIPDNYSFLKHFNEISNHNTLEYIKNQNPDLLILLDGNNYRNFSKDESEELRKYVKSHNIKTVIIDHHPEVYKDNSDIYINNNCSSTAEEVFKVFSEDFNFDLFTGAAEMAMFGILGDTGRFLYKNPNHRETFGIVSKLLDEGVVIEELQNKLVDLQKEHLVVIAELLKNMDCSGKYNFSFVSDDFAQKYIKDEGDWESFSDGFYYFVNQYLRLAGDNLWGFAIIPDFSTEKSEYRGAFRATNDCVDTSIYARELGGGGHKSASGFSVTANDYKEALDKIKLVISA